MARYHFHLTHSGDIRDEAGIDLQDLHSARCHAVKMVADDLCHTPEKFWASETYRVNVTAPNGLLLFYVEMLAVDAPALGTHFPKG